MKRVTAYKLARLDGFDFYTGNTINYRDAVGKVVKCPNAKPKLGICSNGVIHASKNPNDCFVGASIPCSAYRVTGIPKCGDEKKWGFAQLKILEEITDLDALLGWKYSEALNPISPLQRKHKPSDKDIELLKGWDSVRDSVWDSVRDSVWDSVRDSVWASGWDSAWASVRDSVWASVWDSVWDSAWDSAWDSVRDSVWASVWGYIGSLFPTIKQWKYLNHKSGEYPFQSVVDLWKRGFVPSFDGKVWRLHSGKNATVVFEIDRAELLKGVSYESKTKCL